MPQKSDKEPEGANKEIVMKVACPGCHSVYSVKEELVPATGIRTKCPKCAELITIVPDPSEVSNPEIDYAHTMILFNPLPAQEDEQLREVKSGVTGEPRLAPGLKVTVEETDGYSPGKRYEIKKPVTLIGRSKADILLDDPEVSRKHAAIEMYGDKVVVKDMGSTNGTFLNGFGVKMAFVKDGDEVQVGNTVLKVRFS